MEVISIKDLKKSYRKTDALKGISFTVQQGTIFGIIGPNGAGKTTTLEIIEGLKRQTSGICLVLGLDNLENQSEIKEKIGVQLQSSEYLDNLNLSELIILFASLYQKKADSRAILSKVRLESKRKSLVKELSGGQKQRFTIATALVHDPEILFLDEPTTGLDPKARRDLWELIKELNREGKTIVLTTHYMEEAEYLCDKVAILNNGQIIRNGSPQKLIEDSTKYYRLSFFANKEIESAVFLNKPGILKILNGFPKYLLEIDGPDTLPLVMESLRAANISYSFLNLKAPSLEDVYLEATGKEYSNDRIV